MLRLQRLGTVLAGIGTVAVLTAGCSTAGPQADPPTPHQAAGSSTPAGSSAPATPSTSAGSAAPTTPSPTATATTPDVIAPSSPAVPPATGQAPRLVRYGGDGVTVHGPADVDRLRGTDRSFRQFIGGAVPQDSADCPAGGSITVEAWRADGFAVGDVFGCGGYRAIWGTAGGSWHELLGAQSLWPCARLKHFAVPTSIAGDKCLANGKAQDYTQS